jgi:hypothetical protein
MAAVIVCSNVIVGVIAFICRLDIESQSYAPQGQRQISLGQRPRNNAQKPFSPERAKQHRSQIRPALNSISNQTNKKTATPIDCPKNRGSRWVWPLVTVHEGTHSIEK